MTGNRESAAAGHRGLLDALEAYSRTPRRVVRRAERWRRRGLGRGEIVARAEAVARALAGRGIGAGDRVALHLKDGPLWIAGFFGVLRAGAVAVPLDVAHPPELLREMAGELDLVAWIAEPELPDLGLDLPRVDLDWREGVRDHLDGEGRPGAAQVRAEGGGPGQGGAPNPGDVPEDGGVPDPGGAPDGRRRDAEAPPWPRPDPDDVAQVVLTSGTTSRPRAVQVTHRNLLAVLDSLGQEIERYRTAIRLAPRLRLAVALPFSHLYGQFMGVLLPLVLDADVVAVEPMPAAELAGVLRRERIRVLAAVPHDLRRLGDWLLARGAARWGDKEMDRRLEEARDRSWPRRWLAFDALRREPGRRLVAVVSGGAALDPQLEALWRRLGYLVVQGYGLTEAAPLVTLNHPFRTAPGTVGRPLPGVEIRLADDGEILVRGANVATPGPGGPRIDEEGWLHTGDLGERDEEGRIRFVGRSSDLIVTPAGVNVDTGEVAGELRRSPAIVDAAVLERPWGEPGIVSAVLVCRPGADPGQEVAEANRRLPDAARVREWRVWPAGDLPRTPTGKPRRGELRAWLRSQGPEDGEEADPATPRGAAVARTRATPGGSEVERVVENLLWLSRVGETTEVRAPAAVATPGAAAPGERQAGVPGGERRAGAPAEPLAADVRLDDVLSSLQRMELVAVLEEAFGVVPGDDTAEGTIRLGELAARLTGADRRGEPAAATGAEGGRDEEGEPGSRQRGVPEDGTGESAPGRPHGSGPGERGTEPSPAASGGPARTGGPARGVAADGGDRERPAHDVPWRHSPVVRGLRAVLREAVMRPLAHAVVRLEVGGLRHVDALEPPFIVVANHVSMMDPVLLFALPADLRRRLAPAARWNWFQVHPRGELWYRMAVLGFDLFPLVQAGDWRPTLHIGGRIADRGGCPLVYPEGEISADGRPASFRSGVALISQRLHLPVLPAATAGLRAVLPRGHRVPRRHGGRRPVVAVRFGAALPAVRPDDDLDVMTAELHGRVCALWGRALDVAGAP